MRHPVTVIGYAPHESIIDPEILADYRDYPVGLVMDKDVFEACLHRGTLVPGLTCLYRGHAVRVDGSYGRPQMVQRWVE